MTLHVHFGVSGSGGDSGAPNVRLVIAEAEEHDLEQVPDVSAMDLVTLMSESRPRTDGLVFAKLSEIESSPHCTMEVQYDYAYQCFFAPK